MADIPPELPTSPDAPQPPPTPEPYRAPLPPAPVPLPRPLGKGGIKASTVLGLGCGAFMILGALMMVVVMAVGAPSSVKSGAVLKMTVGGPLPEAVRQKGLEGLFGPKVVTLADHVDNLKKAAVDKRIKGVVLRVEPVMSGWAKVEELRDALDAFKKSGKFVIAWAEGLDEKGYALALGADEIVMPPDSFFEFNGLSMDIGHMPGFLEKLGIQVQYFRYGKYKSASGEQIGRTAFSEPVKEMLNENLDLMFAHLVDAVAARRTLDKEEVLRLIDANLLRSEQALEHKLIDRIAYWDEVEATVRTKAQVKEKDEVKWVTSARYAEVSLDEAGVTEGDDVIAVVHVTGLIVPGKGGVDPFGGGDAQGSTPVIRALRKAEKDDEVKAIVLRVDSPGGSGLGADYIRREIERIKVKKPVVASMSDYAASGGYWVAMSCSAIVAQPTTATGSIGVFALVPNLGGAYEKLALNNEIFKRGAHADALVGARAMDEVEAKAFDDSIHAFYLRFVDLAAKGRGMPNEKMAELAQGRTWYGSKAKELGLVDELGGLDVAVLAAKQKASLPEKVAVTVRVYDHQRTFLEELSGQEDEEGEDIDLAALLLQQLVKASGAEPLLKKAPYLSQFARLVLSGQDRQFALADTVEVH